MARRQKQALWTALHLSSYSKSILPLMTLTRFVFGSFGCHNSNNVIEHAQRHKNSLRKVLAFALWALYWVEKHQEMTYIVCIAKLSTYVVKWLLIKQCFSMPKAGCPLSIHNIQLHSILSACTLRWWLSKSWILGPNEPKTYKKALLSAFLCLWACSMRVLVLWQAKLPKTV